MKTRIKEYRKSSGLSQGELAKTTKLSRPVISQFEKGKRNPSLKSLKLIADVFGVPPYYLIIPKDEFEKLNPSEKILLSAFRNLSIVDRKHIYNLIKRFLIN